ncbi:MAG TPA: ABC transporter permease [Bryobacteraceae bacterium]|nr:ABC transporter permease [Bryobacteraceae bacterium]
MRTFWSRVVGLFLRRRLECDLADEFGSHLEMLEDEYRQRGMDARSARAAARRDFGNVEQVREMYRDARGWPVVENLLRDIRYTARGLCGTPGFTAAAVLSLALGIGANTAIFSFVNALLLRMLPVERPEELLALHRIGGWGSGYVAWPMYLRLRELNNVFEGVLARSGVWKVRLDTGTERTDFVHREFVSGNYFSVLGIEPALGRLITDGDSRVPQGHPVAVLSYDCWRNRFAGDPHILGRVLNVDDQALTIIGVAQPRFRGVELGKAAEIWVPAMMHRVNFTNPGSHWAWMLARPRPGVSRQHIQAVVNAAVARYLADQFGGRPDNPFRRRSMEQRIEIRSGGVGISQLRDNFRRPLDVLMVLVVVVLLATCVNIANLLLARAAARRRDAAVRLCLGASRGRLLQQCLLESTFLAAAGGALGLLSAIAGSRYILMFLPAAGDTVPLDITPDATVLLFTGVVAMASAFLFGFAPAMRATAVDPISGLRGVAGSAVRRVRLREGLLVVQVALSVLLVGAAVTFVHTLIELRSVDPGFRHTSVISFGLDYPRAWNQTQRTSLRTRLLERAAALPGVLAVAAGFPGPYRTGSSSSGVRVHGLEGTAGIRESVSAQVVTPGYFETIGATILYGRGLEGSDSTGARRVAVVNEAFARHFFGTGDPIGRTLTFEDGKPQSGATTFIVGIVRNMLHDGLRASPEPVIYVPAAQKSTAAEPIVLVRAELPAERVLASIRAVLAGVDPTVSLDDARTIAQRIADSIFLDRILAIVSGFFGVLALVLVIVGLYGVMAYTVARRTSEIGIRLALGAERTRVVRLILSEALVLIALGAAAGVPVALAARRVAASLLFGVPADNGAAMTITAGALLATGLTAALIPAWRAASIRPIDALRHE